MRKKVILAISMSISFIVLIISVFFLGKAVIDKKRENATDTDENANISENDGTIPHIGENGNWWIGSSDTGFKAIGTDGKDGKDGMNGSDGSDGKDGDTPYIKNGIWWIGQTNTGIRAEGQNGIDGKDGERGDDGDTPFIKNGTWWIGEIDTGVAAVGKDGKDGEDGKPGEDGATPYVFGGTWWIDGYDTGVVAEGKNGVDGIDGNGIIDVKIEDGYFYLMFSDNEGIWRNIGKISSEIPTEDDAGLDYYILPDGTYGVKAGKQLYLDKITIPEKHLGKTVSAILPDAFSGAVNLESIEIPEFIAEIGDNAFADCKKLSSIKLPETISVIGKNVFSGCENITIYAAADSKPDGWDINYNPDSRPVIFSCNSDVKITSDGLRYKVTPENKITVLGYTGSSYSLLIPEKIEDKNVTEIAENAFEGSAGILSVTIPNTVTSIGKGAFKGCCRLVEVYNLTKMNMTLGDNAFGGITKYAKAIHTSAAEDSILEDFESEFVFINFESKYHLVYYTGNEKSIVLPESCNGSPYVVNDYAFYGISNIESIVISEKITSIGAYSFAECRSVTSLYFGASNLTMLNDESNAFLGLGRNSSGVSLTVGKGVNNLPAKLFATNIDNAESSPKITEVFFEIGSVCKSIGARAFMNVYSLTDITIPGSVEKIEAKAFSGCSSLVYVKAEGLFFANNTVPVYFNSDFEMNAKYLTDTYADTELKRQ